MDYQQAFKILNLPTNSNEEKIVSRYKELAKENHPDKGGSDEPMSNILMAKDIALAYSNKKQLVPIDVTRDIITKELIEYQNTFKDLEKTEQQITRRYVSRYKRYKNFAGIFGVFTGGFAFVNTIYSNEFFPIELTQLHKTSLFILAFVMGLYYWIFSSMAETINNHIIEVLDEFDDKEIYINEVDKIIPPEKRHGFTKRELIDMIGSWSGNSAKGHIEPLFMFPFLSHSWSIKKLARNIGPKDFSKILILKGLKNDVLEEKEISDDQGYLSLNYVLKLKSRASA